MFAAVATLVVVPPAMAAPTSAESCRAAGREVTKLHFHEGIACDACSKRPREAMTKLDGIVAVEVDRAPAYLAVDFDASKTTEQTVRA